MGHYSTLQIGEHDLQWKYDIPAFLSFLFEESDSYNEDRDDEEGGFPLKIGYRTNAAGAIKKLDKLGMNWKMIKEIYSFFYQRLSEEVAENIINEIAEQYKDSSEKVINAKTTIALEQFQLLSREDELKDFTRFFLPMIDVSVGKKNLSVKSIDGKVYKIPVEKRANLSHNMLYDPGDFFFKKATKLPPWIQVIGSLFDYDLLMEYTEIISVVEIRLLLEASKPDTIVELQLEDMVDNKEEIVDFHQSSATRIIDKIQLYNKFFNSIMDQETLIKDIYLRDQISFLLEKIPDAKSNLQKGKYLEDLVESIFSAVTGLEVIEKRISTSDEEIDLIVKNGVTSTFWTALMSPIFLVECKNWSTKVGSSEIRDFEVKVVNHRKLAKIGFFVSFNGFTKEASNALKRASREDHHIVLIDKKDIELSNILN